MKFFAFLTIFLILAGFSGLFAWFTNWLSPSIANAPKIVYWDKNGKFAYSGGLVSTLSGSQNFSGQRAIFEIKSLYSLDSDPLRYYIEYPNFSEISNLTIVNWLQEKMRELSHPKNNFSASGSLQKLAFDAEFSLKFWENIAAIVYDIHRRNLEMDTVDATKKVFLINEDGEIFSPKDLVNLTPHSEELMKTLLEKFSEQHAEKPALEKSLQEQNLVAYFQDPQLAFSWSEVIWYIPSHILSTSEAKNLEIIVPYSAVKKWVDLTIKKPEPPTPKPVAPHSAATKPQKNDSKKYVALTFDDGPHPKYTLQLLKTLEEKGVKATFFVLGKNVEHYPEIAKKIVENGHEIANHSYDHSNFLKLSKQSIRNQIQKTNSFIKEATGVLPTLFRPPYGAFNKQVTKASESTIVLWSVDSRDWQNRNVQKNLKATMSAVHDGAIILYHDIHKTSVDTIPALIDELRAKGYHFLTVSDMYEKYYQQKLLPEQVCFSMSKC